ncbi:hypothetical protein [Falsiroseomonas selenitidurans]|uniref:Uncharacterized protein n=1 Tax=Falsiroseomonas selenitidurans TaxID=2716335 RepID=A0ABX1EC73_9PROT|nr:hypothetical protein [Falsiroseomonas selenitidurans]NKC34453.1 hypothetical protein [Falsiroseomonas selenitidurans]
MVRRSLFALSLALAALLAPAPAAAQDSPYAWTSCGREGWRCQVIGEAIVRYGAPGRWVTRTVRGHIECSNQAFGSDPAPGVPKSCGWRPASTARNGPPNLASQPRPVTPPPGARRALPWENAAQPRPNAAPSQRGPCAQEGQRCAFSGARLVTYGVPGRVIRRQGINGIDCNNLAFGRDPAPNTRKSCWLE